MPPAFPYSVDVLDALDAPRTVRPTVRVSFPALLVGMALLALVSLALRPLLPVDETRYASVAWEMWQHGSAWVPQLNGEFYDHKPPLLFWLIHLGWSVGGVGAVWPRLIGPLATLGSALLVARFAGLLWPAHRGVGALAGTLFIGTGFVAAYGTALMFDLPLLCAVLAAWIGLWQAARRGRTRDWALYGIGIGLGALIKGPVVLLYTLPPALLWRGWRPRAAAPLRWSGALLAAAFALAPPLLWLSLAAADGSSDYLQALLVDQTVQRVAGDLGHHRPFWWYLPLLLLVLLPWTLWPTWWRGVVHALRHRAEPGLRFVLVALISALALLSTIHGKQVHYLMPAVALAALLAARGVITLPRAARSAGLVAAASLACVALLLAAAFSGPLAGRYDLAPIAHHVAAAQQRGRDVAYVGHYQGEFGFLGRLAQPITVLRPGEAMAWARAHPDGVIVVRSKRWGERDAKSVEFRRPYKTDELLMLDASRVAASAGAFRDAAPPPTLSNDPRKEPAL